MVYIIDECYLHNIFTKNHKWEAIISFNLNLQFKLLFFFPLITVNSKTLLKICCKNVIEITFLYIITILILHFYLRYT